MKRCPECRRDYCDDSLPYCPDDGTAPLEGSASANRPATALLHVSLTAEPSTIQTHIYSVDVVPATVFSYYKGQDADSEKVRKKLGMPVRRTYPRWKELHRRVGILE